MFYRLVKLLVIFFLSIFVVRSAEIRGADKASSGLAKKNGLTLAVSLDKTTYEPGEDITLSFKLTNESAQDVFVGDGFLAPVYHEVGIGRHFELHLTDENKSALRFWSGQATEGFASGARKVFRLKPGENYHGLIYIVASGKHEIRTEFPKRGGGSHFFVQKSQSGHVENIQTRSRYELGKDGHRYSLTLVYQVDPRTHSTHDPPNEFKDEMLWKGTMEMTPLEFAIVEVKRPAP